MPIGSFRRPELRAAAEIETEIKRIPWKYAKHIAGSNNIEKYMSLLVASKELRGTTVSQLKDTLRMSPFKFKFDNTTIKDKSNIYRVSKNFDIGDIYKFFRVSNYQLLEGMSCLTYLIDVNENTSRVLESMELDILEIRQTREQFALEITKRYSIVEFNLEFTYYIFGPANKFELSELFFVMPSSFVSDSYCSKCDREITNWISVILGKGPICGDHKYEIANIGKSLQEISEQIIKLVERKYIVLAGGPIHLKSPLVQFRKSRLECVGEFCLATGDLYFDQMPFLRQSILRDIQRNEYPSKDWEDYIFQRVVSEYRQHENTIELEFED